MAYKQLWTKMSPGHIVFLIDLSGSMELDGKIDYTINVLNDVFRTLVGRCIKRDSVAPKLSCTVIGYNRTANVIWDDMPILDIAIKVQKFRKKGVPIFDKNTEFKPQDQTWMRLAFDEAKKDIEKWMAKQKTANMSIPAPIVINVTDGHPYEGKEKTWEQVSKETLQSVRTLMNISTPDGNVRVFNIHHDPQNVGTISVFPSQRPTHPAEQFLFDASSEMDDETLKTALIKFEEYNISKGAKYMVTNVKEPSMLLKLIEFGTISQMSEDGSYFSMSYNPQTW